MRPEHTEPRLGQEAGRPEPTPPSVRIVSLALQGGGAHGAFAWGVLDRILEDDRISVEGISATSAGAVNAVVFAHGFNTGGRDGARQALRDFWRRIADVNLFSPLQPSLFERFVRGPFVSNWSVNVLFDILTRLLSPYQFNPLNYNPLRTVLEQTVDFERLRNDSGVKLFLSATNVRTGKIRVFDSSETSADVVLASACLPFMFQAVEIDGEHFWDGGYMGNPAIFPLIYHCKSEDVIVVHINPIARPEVPTTAAEILNRVNEISFNSSLMREMRAIAFVNELIESGKLHDADMRRIRVHAIEAEEVMRDFGAASKLDAEWSFLLRLFDLGRERAGIWLANDFANVGRCSTSDIRSRYL